MSLGDLPNDTARDATDFATEIGGGHSGLPRIPPCERQLLQDYVITGGPPGGDPERGLQAEVRIQFVLRKIFG